MSEHDDLPDGTPADPHAHPEELLAVYVDGSASSEERDAAVAHLATCARCREEIELAGGVFATLSALPEVTPPARVALDDPGVAAVIDIRSRRRWRSTVAAALGAAAVIVAGVLVLQVGSGPRQEAAAPAQLATTASQPSRTVTAADLNELTYRLAGTTPAASPGGSAAPTSGVGAPSAPSLLSADPVKSVVTCSRAAAGLSASATAIYYEAATYAGQPASIVGYLLPADAGGPEHVVVIAVARSDCSVLYLTRVPKASP